MFHFQRLPGEPRQAHVAGNDFLEQGIKHRSDHPEAAQPLLVGGGCSPALPYLGWDFMQEHSVVKLNKIVFPDLGRCKERKELSGAQVCTVKI